jgi:hypothetical protein
MTKLVIAYTRGRKLHAARLDEGRTSGATLCGSYGFQHPRFDSGTGTAVGLTLRFNGGCAHCIRALDRTGA